MRNLVIVLVAMLASASISQAQERTPDARVADLVQTGRIRVGLFPPQYAKDAATGELKGVWAVLVFGLFCWNGRHHPRPWPASGLPQRQRLRPALLAARR
jgi:hypothetical protein